MAFSTTVGNVLRQGAARSTQAPVASMLNYIRCMSSSKLFIGGLSYGVDDQSLKDAFASFGDVVEGEFGFFRYCYLVVPFSNGFTSRVITDRDTGRSRGFGFVNFSSDESATTALSAMDGQDLNGRNIRVSYATDRSSGPRPGGGGGGFGGGGYAPRNGGGGW
ncbi:Glycine-rich RNA-binding protein [Vigna angularis]|uniref:Glycine-rich RNA-binding protein n=1 Tax=Phaseolus angularis TaxID=3914 RepID=A0A8T0L4S4_PHAAN|nr:Glycine-rich RNA-binding protein [Vigna angularis]